MLTTGRPLARARHAGRATPPRCHVRSLLAAPTSSLPQPPGRAPLSCETFRREPATRQFVWSFAPMPMSCHRVEHQNGSGPPPVFLPASASTGIVHCLSGPTAATRRSPAAPGLPPSPRRGGGLLGPCFNTGPSPRLLSCIFTFHPHTRPFHISLAVLLRYRTPRVFSLGCCYHPFALHYQAALLVPRACSGALTRCGRAFHRVHNTFCATTPEGLPPGLFPVRSPLLRKSTFVSFPGLSDMLKSGPSSCAARIIRSAAVARRFSHSVAFVIVWGAYRSHTGGRHTNVFDCNIITGLSSTPLIGGDCSPTGFVGSPDYQCHL